MKRKIYIGEYGSRDGTVERKTERTVWEKKHTHKWPESHGKSRGTLRENTQFHRTPFSTS